MRETIIFVLSFFTLFLFIPTVFAQEPCKVAYPQFGVISCDPTGKELSKTKNLSDFYCGSDKWCSISWTCDSNCELYRDPHIDDCGLFHSPEWKVLLGEEELDGQYKNTPIEFQDGETLTIKITCVRWLIGGNKLPSNNSYVQFRFDEIILYDDNPDWHSHYVPNSQHCIMQSFSDLIDEDPQYSTTKNSQVVSGTIPNEFVTVQGIKSKPTDLKNDIYKINVIDLGRDISYFHKWIIIDSINLELDKFGNPIGYCGGRIGNRVLYSWQEISTNNGCYLLPDSGKGTDVECCNDADCYSQNKICDPTTHKCSNEKPCDSTVECLETTCNNRILTNWFCDKSEPFYPKSGTCKKQIENVACCSSECVGDTHCDYAKGCISNIQLNDCPVGKCCESGGNYKPKPCPSGLQCCHTTNPIIGECKSSCVEQAPTEGEPGGAPEIGGQAIVPDKPLEPPMLPILIILTVIIAGVGGYVFLKKKRISIPAKKKSVKAQIKTKVKYCSECGAKQNVDKKFCTDCGKKLK